MAAAPSIAGSIEITLKERDGNPIGEQWIAVESSAADFLHRTRRARTDFDGTASFTGLSAGTYRITVGSLRARDLVPPSENPFAPPPVVTLATDDEHLQIDVELWRGVRVVSQILLDRSDPPPSTVRYHSLESDLRLESGFDPAGYAERVLVPGRWRVSIDPPPGYLLTDFEING
ncbi:MAG: carboxypeptidase-like regulatory domain-containing protein, partial [Acidobacteriota bacterium]|nr:carboxypeptidase-like regulatory domain-containing protein [Acidobacteriota bacterium]